MVQTQIPGITAKSPEEIRKTFNITNDFSPEEEDQVRRENGKSCFGMVERHLDVD